MERQPRRNFIHRRQRCDVSYDAANNHRRPKYGRVYGSVPRNISMEGSRVRMNDLVVVGRDQFYITRFTWFRSFVWIRLSHWLHIPEGAILFYDGDQVMRALPDSYFLLNGINASPDKKTIYVAELGTKIIHALQRDDKLTTTWK
ncbi:serum paraoxonase/lactonase 3-like isoform X2 [Mya arenaria]|uniref:serum paraoxonase/lactonase 3-like isoform X2 n=1 Tax=Mya arenaria TaxID=6604 RepID=UPI0022E1A223|nr:serum paraoxonase/lactonase 3-like isoform X2 [Mya arenaria]